MGSYYYYLVPQLSYLIYGMPPPMSSQEFRAAAAGLLSEEDRALMNLLSLDPQPLRPDTPGSGISYAESMPSSGSDFIDGWREWERTLRLNLAKLRAVKMKREGEIQADAPGFPADAVAAAAKAVQETPLEGEILIDKARWSAIDALQGTDYFYRNTVFAYLLKLIILERNALFQAEKGFSEYKSLYTSILESAKTGASPMGEPT